MSKKAIQKYLLYGELVCVLLMSCFFAYRILTFSNSEPMGYLLARLICFVFALLINHPHSAGLIAPTTLIFYGLSLINASKYTYSDIKFLGICEVVLGLIAMFNIGLGLYFWAFGFGVLHILYGSIMYYKYEKK